MCCEWRCFFVVVVVFTVNLKNVEKFEMVGDQWTVGNR